MRSSPAARVAVALTAALAATPADAACPDPASALGVARVVEIDTAGGPMFGALTSQQREGRFLAPREVVLTFDDGPMPRITSSILDTLDRYCTKATFFSVGRMAVSYPALTKEILTRGHTLGTHTWSHPILTHQALDRARDQIDSGFAAVALAAGRPIAPFFRFPGLNDSPALLDHLQRRGIAAFTVDVVSNDSYIRDPGQLIARTLQHAQAQNGGILLFHDIKYVTARALPTILRELKARGFSIVHLRARTPYVPASEYLAAVRERVQRTMRGTKAALLAVTADLSASQAPAPAPLVQGQAVQTAADEGPPVTTLAPPPRDRSTSTRPAIVAGPRRQPVLAETQGRSHTLQAPRDGSPSAASPARWHRFWQGVGG